MKYKNGSDVLIGSIVGDPIVMKLLNAICRTTYDCNETQTGHIVPPE